MKEQINKNTGRTRTFAENQNELYEKANKEDRLLEYAGGELDIIWDKDLKDYQAEEQEWLIDELMPSNSIGILTGKRGSFKTFLSLNAVFCIALGEPFLERTTKKCKVLYFDRENGVIIIRDRMSMIKSGEGLKGDLDVGYIFHQDIKLDELGGQALVESLIEEHKPSLVVFDTYRRFIGYDENDAGATSKLFVDFLKPLSQKNKTSILLIHHNKKGESPDKLDEVRGSSDLVNYVDFVLCNNRNGGELVLRQLKCRNAPEINPINVGIEQSEDSIKFYSKGDYTPTTKDNAGAIQIMDWIIKEGKQNFKTKEINELLKNKISSRTTVYNALTILCNSGLIKKEGRGFYEVISKDAKLIV